MGSDFHAKNGLKMVQNWCRKGPKNDPKSVQKCRKWFKIIKENIEKMVQNGTKIGDFRRKNSNIFEKNCSSLRSQCNQT